MITPGKSKHSLNVDTDRRAQVVRETHPFLTAKQVAFYLSISVATLARMRRNETGPKCHMNGGFWAYHVDDLEAWLASRSRGSKHG